jgi:hypothetical protein
MYERELSTNKYSSIQQSIYIAKETARGGELQVYLRFIQ